MNADALAARTRSGTESWRSGLSALLGLALAAALYSSSFAETADAWYRNSKYLFGYLVPPLALFTGAWTWRRTAAQPQAKFEPRDLRRGLRELFAGVAAHFTAIFFHNLAVDVLGLILIVRGVVIVCAGYETLRRYDFAVFFLAFLIPVTIPVDFFPALTTSLEHLVAFGSAAVVDLASVPVFRDGLDLRFGELTLTVNAARSGLSDGQAALACCLFAGFVSGHGSLYRSVLALLSLPIAAAAQSVGLIVAGILLHWRGVAVADEFARNYGGALPLIVTVGLTVAAALSLHVLVTGIACAASRLSSIAARIPRTLKGSAA